MKNSVVAGAIKSSLLPGAGWKADNLVNIFLYWTVVMATLLGADAVKALTNK